MDFKIKSISFSLHDETKAHTCRVLSANGGTKTVENLHTGRTRCGGYPYTDCYEKAEVQTVVSFHVPLICKSVYHADCQKQLKQ